MARETEGIEPLGESLLARAESRTDQRRKDSRKQAYKMALLRTGAGLINQTLTNKARDFVTSEEAMSKRAKYRAAVAKSEDISKQYQKMQDSDQDPAEYFMNTRYLPAMEEEYKARHGEQYVPESYMPQLRDEARRLAEEDANEFMDAVEVAQGIPDMETAMQNFDSVVMPPTNIGGALLEKVEGFFTNKSSEDFRQEALDEVENSGLLKNETYRRAFNKVSNNDGIDEAINFVKGLDTSGFTENETVEADVDVRSDGQGGVNVTTIREVKDSEGSSVDISHKTKNVPKIETEEEKQEVVRGIVNDIDIPDQLDTFLTTEARSQYMNNMSEEGVDPFNISTTEELRRATAGLRDVMKAPANLRDDVRTTAVADSVAALLGSMEPHMDALFSGARTEGDTAIETFGNLLEELNTAVENTKAIQQPDEEVEREFEPTPIGEVQEGGGQEVFDFNTLD